MYNIGINISVSPPWTTAPAPTVYGREVQRVFFLIFLFFSFSIILDFFLINIYVLQNRSWKKQ